MIQRSRFQDNIAISGKLCTKYEKLYRGSENMFPSSDGATDFHSQKAIHIARTGEAPIWPTMCMRQCPYGLFTLPDPDSDAQDPDPDLNQCEYFYIVQCNHRVWNPSPSPGPNPSPAM